MDSTIDFWFEVFSEGNDEIGTQTFHTTASLSNAKQYAKDFGLKIDLWIVDGTNNQMPIPVVEIFQDSTVESIELSLSHCSENVATDLKEFIVKKLKEQN